MLEDLLYKLPHDVIRAKGFVMTDNGSFLMNFVFGRFDFEKFDAKRSELVFIGRNMKDHEEAILKALRECEAIE